MGHQALIPLFVFMTSVAKSALSCPVSDESARENPTAAEGLSVTRLFA